MQCAVFWLHCREKLPNKWGHPEESLWTEYIQAELETCLGGDAAACQDTVKAYQGRVVGAMVCSGSMVPSITSVLSPSQHCVWDFWALSRYVEEQLFFCTVHECFTLAEPQLVRESNLRQMKSGSFFKMTAPSCEKCFATETSTGDTVQSILNAWALRYGLPDLTERPQRTTLDCCNMFAPHCVLVASGRWKSYAFPVPACKQSRNSLGMSIANRLWRPLGINLAAPAVAANAAVGGPEKFSAPLMQDMADQLRILYNIAVDEESMTQEELQHLEGQISFLQDFRDKHILQEADRERTQFRLEYLLSNMMLAGYLKQSSNLLEALKWAIQISVPHPGMREELRCRISKPHAAPSRSTLHRHRLTVICQRHRGQG